MPLWDLEHQEHSDYPSDGYEDNFTAYVVSDRLKSKWIQQKDEDLRALRRRQSDNVAVIGTDRNPGRRGGGQMYRNLTVEIWIQKLQEIIARERRYQRQNYDSSEDNRKRDHPTSLEGEDEDEDET